MKNSNQTDEDGDKIGDVCDNCRNMKNKNQNDDDKDNYGNACDTCRYVYNPQQEVNAFDVYGRDTCENEKKSASVNNDENGIKDSLAAQIMEKLLQMYYSN